MRFLVSQASLRSDFSKSFLPRFLPRYGKSTIIIAALLSGFLSACDTKTADEKTADESAPAYTQSSAQPKPSTPPSQNDSTVVQALQQNLEKSDIALNVISAVPTPIEGIYWATFDNSPPMFTDAKGEYLIQGQIARVGVEKPFDIVDEIQASLAKEQLSQVDANEMIIYPAKERLATVYVFTDPTCHYCQKLHKEIKEINAKGVEVRYLAWPRNEQFIQLAERIWCASDRQEALSLAKQGDDITAPACDNPVAKHMTLGHQIGVSGTPAIFTESGVQIGGYLPADELAKQAIAHKN